MSFWIFSSTIIAYLGFMSCKCCGMGWHFHAFGWSVAPLLVAHHSCLHISTWSSIGLWEVGTPFTFVYFQLVPVIPQDPPHLLINYSLAQGICITFWHLYIWILGSSHFHRVPILVYLLQFYLSYFYRTSMFVYLLQLCLSSYFHMVPALIYLLQSCPHHFYKILQMYMFESYPSYLPRVPTFCLFTILKCGNLAHCKK